MKYVVFMIGSLFLTGCGDNSGPDELLNGKNPTGSVQIVTPPPPPPPDNDKNHKKEY